MNPSCLFLPWQPSVIKAISIAGKLALFQAKKKGLPKPALF
jgi:hypothetical protein